MASEKERLDLAEHFRAHVSERSSVLVSLQLHEQVPALLEEIIHAARVTWPTVHLAPEHYVAYLAARVSLDEPADVALGRLCTGDLYLACACSRGDIHALSAFEEQCLTVIDGALRTLRGDADLTAEIKQRLRQTLLVGGTEPPKITLYAGRGRLRDWLRVSALREGLAETRRRRSESAESQLDQIASTMSDPELEYMKTLYKQEFERALQQATRMLVPRDRNLLRQHFVQGMSIDELGRRHGVHRATAARWLERATRALLTNARAALSKRLQVQPGELDSILGLIRSRVDVSLRTLFRRRGRAHVSS